MDHAQLVQRALEARTYSYSPYSHFQVGAALLAASGRVYTGCNIESVSFSPTICAERTAFFSAVSQGEREFVRIAIVGGPAGSDSLGDHYTAPCGVCRQVMAEFCRPDEFEIVLANDPDGPFQVYTLAQLLPLAFGPDALR